MSWENFCVIFQELEGWWSESAKKCKYIGIFLIITLNFFQHHWLHLFPDHLPIGKWKVSFIAKDTFHPELRQLVLLRTVRFDFQFFFEKYRLGYSGSVSIDSCLLRKSLSRNEFWSKLFPAEARKIFSMIELFFPPKLWLGFLHKDLHVKVQITVWPKTQSRQLYFVLELSGIGNSKSISGYDIWGKYFEKNWITSCLRLNHLQ